MKSRLGFVKVFLLVGLFATMLLLQGCSLKEAETTIKVTQSDDKRKLQVELKADTSKNYEWKYFTLHGIVTESTLPDNTKDLLSTTYITKYRFSANDEGQETMYFVLIKDGDLETAKAYVYDITVDANSAMIVSSPTELSVNLYPDIMERLKNM